MKFSEINDLFSRLKAYFVKYSKRLEIPRSALVDDQLRKDFKFSIPNDMDIEYLVHHPDSLKTWRSAFCGASIEHLLSLDQDFECACFRFQGYVRHYYQNYYAVRALDMFALVLKLYRYEEMEFCIDDYGSVLTFFKLRMAIHSKDIEYNGKLALLERIVKLHDAFPFTRSPENDERIRVAFAAVCGNEGNNARRGW